MKVEYPILYIFMISKNFFRILSSNDIQNIFWIITQVSRVNVKYRMIHGEWFLL